jgi:tetratricopeptide (TPR) repeat protein
VTLPLFVGACVAAPPAPRAIAVVTVPPAARSTTPRERVEAALRAPGSPRWPRIELTMALASPWTNLVDKPAPPPKRYNAGVAVLCDMEIPGRDLARADLQPLESPWLARHFLGCFLHPDGDESRVPVAHVALSAPNLTRVSAEPSRDALTRCVEERALDADVPVLGIQQNVRLAARARSVDGAWKASGDRGSIGEEIGVLESMVGSPEERARALPLLSLLGTRYVEAFLLDDRSVENRLGQARAVLERVVTELPEGEARASALFRLAQALEYAGEPTRALSAYRAVACPARFPFTPGEPKALPHDHTTPYWDAWWHLHETPVGLEARSGKKPKAKVPAGTADGPRTWAEETVYASPYEGCTLTSAPSEALGALVSDSWRVLGAYHAIESDERSASGPFHLDRAVTAYREALRVAHPPEATPFLLLGLGRTLLGQERYAEAARTLVSLLTRLEAHPQEGDPELVTRATQLLATSLTYVDFEGPGEGEPHIARPDVLFNEPRPEVAEKKLRVALERVRDPSIVPQDRAFTPFVVYWLSWELRQINHWQNALLAQSLFLERWPLHRDAPLVQWEQAGAHAWLARTVRQGTPEHARLTQIASEARAKLSISYIGGTPWAEANRGDDEAIHRAEKMARTAPP